MGRPGVVVTEKEHKESWDAGNVLQLDLKTYTHIYI